MSISFFPSWLSALMERQDLTIEQRWLSLVLCHEASSDGLLSTTLVNLARHKNVMSPSKLVERDLHALQNARIIEIKDIYRLDTSVAYEIQLLPESEAAHGE